MIGELGLRYRPSAAADLEAHAARLALLALDIADCSPELLRYAIRQWVRQSRFMPTAAELFAIMDAERERRRPRPAPEPIAAAEAMIEGPIEVIPADEIRAMPAHMVRMGLAKGWITQAQVDEAGAAG